MLKLGKSTLVIKTLFLLIFILTTESAYAQEQESPFRFNLIPSYEDGKITYQIDFRKTVDWNITDVSIKIPLPEGTRFLEAKAIPSIETTFDGKEITFFTSVYNRVRRGDALFTIEVTNPTVTIFTTNAWISWKGDYPGNYLADEVDIDITRKPLDWDQPSPSRLQLGATATVDNEIITYYIYPKNIDNRRMWDVRINIPVPKGTTFLSAEAPPPFISNFNGEEVSFSAIELASEVEISPLSFKVSTENITDPYVTTHAWAVWKNSDRRVGTDIVFQEETRTGDIIVQPGGSQSVVSDVIGDVPFSNYDVTSIAFQDYTSAFKVTFYTVGDVGKVGNSDYLDFRIYIDSDCNVETGQNWNGMGSDHYVRYRHDQGKAELYSWDKEDEWKRDTSQIQIDTPLSDKQIAMWIPYDILNLKNERYFCSWSLSRNYTQGFISDIPTDYIIPTSVIKLAPSGKTPPIEIPNVDSFNGTFIDIGDTWQYLPGWTEPESDWMNIDFDDSNWFSGPTGIGYGSGKLATDLNLITSDIQSDSAPALVEHTSKETGVTLTTLSSGAEDNVSLYTRRAFTVIHPLTQLTLEINYEDGFVAYLNGAEVARRGFRNDSPVPYDTFATQRKADTSEIIDLSDHISKLRTDDTNVLAIQVHRSVDTPLNLFVAPKLTWQNNPQEITTEQESSDLANETTPTSLGRSTFSLSDLSGKLAVPIDTGQVTYDIHIFSLPDGQEITKIPNARQPYFRFDGQRLLINHEGGGTENVFEYNFVDGTERQVSDAPQDWHPVYDPWGNRVAYGNTELTTGRPEPLRNSNGGIVHGSHDADVIYNTPKKPFIFVQCGLLPPHQETEARCRDIPNLGVLIPAGQTGEIQGTHPVWASNDMIVYKGCNTWLTGSLCGIFIVPSASTKGFSDGFIPRRLTEDTSDIPTDTKDNLIAFMSARDDNWEAYVMDLNGDGLRNLSNSPESNDGLPTISPDSNWVAFISDRGGQWAVWVTPIAGGSVQKLFDLPSNAPWGDDERSWTNERISWGP